jgi:hypothetical protein
MVTKLLYSFASAACGAALPLCAKTKRRGIARDPAKFMLNLIA